MATLECPRRSLTTLGLSPSAIRRLAQLCRRSYSLKCVGNAARLRAAWNQRRSVDGSCGPPCHLGKTRAFCCQRAPARNLSSPCRRLCSESCLSKAGESGIVRREREVFGSLKYQRGGL